jgi:hypothetical protein
MQVKRTAPYEFDVGKKSPRFKRLYQKELNRVRLAHRIAERREKCGLRQTWVSST